MGRDSPSNPEIQIHSGYGDHSVHPSRPTPSPPPPPPSRSSDANINGDKNDSSRKGRNRSNNRHPNGDKNFSIFRRWKPWLIPGFIVVNVVLFIVTMFINDCPANSDRCFASFLGRFSFQPLKENPLLGPSAATLLRMGAQEVHLAVQEHEVWRLLSSIWVHAGVVHVFANMLSLVFIGIRLEQEFGFVRIGSVYLISGYGGSLMSALFSHSNISVGASGALFGLLGAMLSELITNWTIYANKLTTLLILMLVVVVNLAMGLLPHVDNFAHIGGFLTGFFLGFVFLIRPQFGWVTQRNALPGYVGTAQPKHKTYQYVLWVKSVILLIAGLTAGTILLLHGVNLNDHCSWCQYFSCVPMGKWSCKAQEQMFCESRQLGTQLNMTCSGNGQSSIYTLNLNDLPSSKLQEMCYQLCN